MFTCRIATSLPDFTQFRSCGRMHYRNLYLSNLMRFVLKKTWSSSIVVLSWEVTQIGTVKGIRNPGGAVLRLSFTIPVGYLISPHVCVQKSLSLPNQQDRIGQNHHFESWFCTFSRSRPLFGVWRAPHFLPYRRPLNHGHRVTSKSQLPVLVPHPTSNDGVTRGGSSKNNHEPAFHFHLRHHAPCATFMM
jgi:hypothetical protein